MGEGGFKCACAVQSGKARKRDRVIYCLHSEEHEQSRQRRGGKHQHFHFPHGHNHAAARSNMRIPVQRHGVARGMGTLGFLPSPSPNARDICDTHLPAGWGTKSPPVMCTPKKKLYSYPTETECHPPSALHVPNLPCPRRNEGLLLCMPEIPLIRQFKIPLKVHLPEVRC